MIVISVTDCPPKVRGDLSKWLCELNTGVYVGNLSSRVRDELWTRICQNLRTGRATMVFSAQGEQHMDFRVHNTTWETVDFDGLKLMRRPLPVQQEKTSNDVPQTSKAAQFQKVRRIDRSRRKAAMAEDYVVIDLETTGMRPEQDEIIEIAAIRVCAQAVTQEFSVLVRPQKGLPQTVKQLTGITEEALQKEGMPLQDALAQFVDFVGRDRMVGHNISFDLAFLRTSLRACGQKMLTNPCVDTLALARRTVFGVENYKLATLAQHFSMTCTQQHRALEDCRVTNLLYQKLKKT